MSALKIFGISIDEREAVEPERIVIDGDEEEALAFLKAVVHRRVIDQQTNKLQSHLDAGGDPTGSFAERTGHPGAGREGGGR